MCKTYVEKCVDSLRGSEGGRRSGSAFGGRHLGSKLAPCWVVSAHVKMCKDDKNI